MQPPLFQTLINKDIIFQGDIFYPINFYIGNNLENIENVSEGSNLFIGIRPAIIVSQTCDIDKSYSVLLSPIYTFEEYVASEELKDPEKGGSKALSRMEQIKARNGCFEKFYLGNINIELPNGSLFSDCFADLRIINPIKKELISPPNKFLSLSDWGRHVLNYQLNWLLGRPITDWNIKKK